MPPNNIPISSAPTKRPLNWWMITTIIISVISIGLIGLSVWSFLNYNDQKTNVEGKIKEAESKARNEQAIADEIKLSDSEKIPNREFVGPDDYGRVTFDYPKDWSVYIDKDASDGGDFEAYLNRITIPPISSQQQYALRVVIEQENYEKAIASYDSLVKKGDLKASSVSVNGNNGTRLDGSFTKNIKGSAVIFKIRDKTLTIRTDAETFKIDFDKLISTIKINQ